MWYTFFFIGFRKSDGVMKIDGSGDINIQTTTGKLPLYEDFKESAKRVKLLTEKNNPECLVSITGFVPCAHPEEE